MESPSAKSEPGRRRRRYRRKAPTDAVSITSADVTRQRSLGESVHFFYNSNFDIQHTLKKRETKGGEKMGHTAIPILMAVLSCCVWENVEVRATRSGSSGAMAHCDLFYCSALCFLVHLGTERCVLFCFFVFCFVFYLAFYLFI